MRRLVVPAALVAALVAVSAGHAGSGGANRVTVVESNSTFPDRTYILTLPRRAKLTSGAVRVTENGDSVIDLRVSPVGADTGRRVGNVLLIDASNSMRGKPIKAAMAAARSFAVRRASTQSLAVVAFNDRAAVVLPFTTNDGDIRNALKRVPPTREGTHIYDALQRTVDLIGEARLDSASIVLLSDGADVGSKLDPDKVTQALEGSHVRVFSVGLRSGAYNPSTLTQLATKTRGSYIEASTANLQKVYSALGYQLANEYFVRYRSLAGPNKPVKVKVSVAGFAGAATGYRTPALATTTTELKPFEPSGFSRFIQSGFTMAVLALLVTALVATAIWVVLRDPNRSLQDRLSAFVHIPTEEEARERRREIAGLLAERGSRFKSLRWWQSFAEDVALADIGMTPEMIALWALVAGLAAGLVMTVILGSLIGFLFSFVGPMAARMFVTYRLKRKRRLFGEQLPDNLEVLASALRAGHSLVGGLAVVVEDAPEPSRTEFQRVIADEQLGVPLEDALGVVVRRMDNRDLDQVALVAFLQRDTGGNAAEVLDQVVTNIRGRMELRRLVQTLTAQGRMARWIVSFLPLFLLLAIVLINPDYADPLWHRTFGQVALVTAAILVVCGSLVIRKIIDIKI